MTDSRSLNIFYDFIEAPERSAAALREDPPVGLGLAGYLFSALGLFLAEALTGKTGLLGPTLVGLSAILVWHLGSGVVQTALAHIVSEASGGRGRVLSLFVLMGLSELGWALVLPGVLVMQAFFPEARWSVHLVFGGAWLVVVWLKLRSIRQNYGFGALPACFALLFPYVALAGSMAFVLLIAIWSSVQKLSGLFG